MTIRVQHKKLIVGGGLFALCALIALARLHTYNEPFERDITTYAVIAHGMSQGRPLYSDMWDLKPPAVFVTYQLAELIAGYGPASIYLLGVAAAILTLLALYRAGAIFGGRRCGLWAGVLWTTVCSDLYLQANQPNTEVFINACLAWGFVGVLQLRPEKFNARRVLLIGVLFALASLYKQVTLAVFLLLALAYVLRPTDKMRRTAAMQVVALLALTVAAWAGVVAYFSFTGRWQIFYDTLFVIGRMYAGNIWENLASGFAPGNLWPPILYFASPLLLLSAVGCVLELRQKRNVRRWLLWLAFVVGTQLAVSLPGKNQPHYYQLWLPPLVIGASWALAAFSSFPSAARLRLAPAAGVLFGLFLLGHELPFFDLSADEWSRRKYHGDFFTKERALAHEVNALLKPDETFYEWGRETGLYFHSRRRPPAGVLINYPLYQNPLMASFSRRVIIDLKRTQPEMLVVCTAYPLNSPVIEWLMPRYAIFPRHHERGKFILLARRGGRLQKSLLRE